MAIGSDPVEFIPDLVSPIMAGQAAFILGSRVRGERERGSLTPQQVIAAHVGRLLLRLVYGARFSDLSPFRAIRRDALDRLGMSEILRPEFRNADAGCRCRSRLHLRSQSANAAGLVASRKVSGNFIAGLKATYSMTVTFVRLALRLRRKARL